MRRGSLAAIAFAYACCVLAFSPSCRSMEIEAKVDSLVAKFDGPDRPGACVAVIHDGTFAFKKGYGLAHLEEKIPVGEDTNFRLASVTKQFTAMAILLLKEQGALDYDDPLSRFFPDFPEIGTKITVRHLLNHTSGLIDYENIMPEGLKVPLKDRDVLELLKTQHGTYFTPGTEYRYSNSGYALLALIVEKVSGMGFASFLKENIFSPLGMNDTVAYEEGITTVPRRAYGYKETDAGFVFSDQSLTSSVLGDGGIYTSVLDYFKWDQALYTEGLVSRETLQEAFSPARLADGTLSPYGFGWRFEERQGVRVIYHNGSTCGFSTAVRRVPERQLSVIVLSNNANGKAPSLADELLDWLLSQIARDAPGE